ncbi:GntR family transcriptional regulator [Gulosibacter faecalis]|jgi:DNA-binding GntR family transcriptional regulator|uniref:GntR family transcriptional regulator n=1 Tax=Gulosibacter faecalis TaxID=272240 RepID=A0ABW5UW46_9MICO|nr:GntR family transcriptional regulator [Gulosibacter faecalis]
MQETRPAAAPASGQLPLATRLRLAILDGRFMPGDQMPETSLADEFGVSRTPIREALKLLENEGLVEIRPRVGTFVRVPTRREIVEMFQLKEALEGMGAALMARRGEVPQLELLRSNVADSDAALAANDHAAYAKLVHEFHTTIIRGADNTKLIEHYELMMNQLAYHRLVLNSIEVPGRLEASTHEHHLVLDAIASKDPVAADLRMRGHVYASSVAALQSSVPAADLPE